jgi:hypothetical protein
MDMWMDILEYRILYSGPPIGLLQAYPRGHSGCVAIAYSFLCSGPWPILPAEYWEAF